MLCTGLQGRHASKKRGHCERAQEFEGDEQELWRTPGRR